MPHPILLYDGVCGLCHRFVQFVLRHDPTGVFRFAPLQSPPAARILARHGSDSRDLATVSVVVDYELPEERLVVRSDAVIFILKQLAAAAEQRSAGPPQAYPEVAPGAAVPTPVSPLPAVPRPKLWRFTALVLRLVPRPVRDFGYNIVARCRYRIFGRYDACPLPSPETRARFLDADN
jgi:predicted DCC family thiol-disulfide oxidoreductase YuxK